PIPHNLPTPDHLLKPPQIISAPRVKPPRFIIHAFAHLQERHQVLCPQVQFPLRPAKIETLLRRKFSLGIVSLVASPLRFRTPRLHERWRLARLTPRKPHQGLARLWWRGRWFIRPASLSSQRKLHQCFTCCPPRSNHYVHQ